MRAIYRLIEAVIVNRRELREIRQEINFTRHLLNHFHNRMEDHMATQEERLQAILVGVREAVRLLGELKVNNPAIEDEIAAIEEALAPAEAPTEPPV